MSTHNKHSRGDLVVRLQGAEAPALLCTGGDIIAEVWGTGPDSVEVKEANAQRLAAAWRQQDRIQILAAAWRQQDRAQGLQSGVTLFADRLIQVDLAALELLAAIAKASSSRDGTHQEFSQLEASLTSFRSALGAMSGIRPDGIEEAAVPDPHDANIERMARGG